AELAIALGLIQDDALQNATAAVPGAAQSYLAILIGKSDSGSIQM
ncbi:hypothetical protein A2U01_0094360, partial [Trifolium medium]|nr:hypothetical protein [Trifolium medium]